MLFSRPGSAEWERAGSRLKTQTNSCLSSHNLKHWESHQSENEDTDFFWPTDRNFWTEIFRSAVEPDDIFLIGLWPENCCFSDWSMGDSENCHTDIRITASWFPIHCKSRVRCNRKSSLKLLQQHFRSCITQWAGTHLVPGGKRNASHWWFNAMHYLDYFRSITEHVTHYPKHSLLC